MEREILERLREVMTVQVAPGHLATENAQVIRRILIERQEAADEIERLQEKLAFDYTDDMLEAAIDQATTRGLEQAAKWHHEQANMYHGIAAATGPDTKKTDHGAEARADWHINAMRKIRELSPKD